MWYRIAIPILAFVTAWLGGTAIPSVDDQEVLSDKIVAEFESRIYPLLMGDDRGCFDCHGTGGESDLVFSGNAKEDLLMLVDGQYLGHTGPDSLISRLTSENEQLRMPQNYDAWDHREIDQLRAFLQLLEEDRPSEDRPVDEQFPRALLQPYQGKPFDASHDQFISFRQLRGKIAQIFADDGARGSKNLFIENIALFGGADFTTRFNESREPTAAYLTGLDILASDVSHRAYQLRKGPFAQFPELSVSPLEAQGATQEYRDAINHLYEQVLFRPPTEDEVTQSYKLLREIYQASEIIRRRRHTLSFELTVTDPLSGLHGSRRLEIPVNGDRLEVHQQIVDQSVTAEGDQKVSSLLIGPAVQLNPDTSGQRLVIHNLGTQRNVSCAGVNISPVDSVDEPVQTIDVAFPEIQIDGAWEIDGRGGVQSLEDRNNHKGQSSITIPLSVENAGEYQVELLWRTDPGNANNVLVELFAAGAGNQLASSTMPSRPEAGEAHFYYDCGNDTIAFFKPGTTFQFGQQGYVEISNRGTRQRVTAAAVEFLERSNSTARFLIDSSQAEGNQEWSSYNEGQFKAYNVKGKKLHDGNKRKGELSLRYVPLAHTADKDSNDKGHTSWDPDKFYDVRIYYPGKVNHEPQVPVVIQAEKSAPIIQIEYPMIAKSDARLKLDASNCYTVQQSALQYSWRQLSGVPVDLGDSTQAVIEFSVPRPDIKQYAWSSLCAALLRHPDFLFTRPPSLSLVGSEREKQKLRLVKIALDLVGRPPTSGEIKKLDDGARLSDLIDAYLDSREFRNYYFHLVRLKLESHGTDLDDEPARLWCYVAFHDRPFQEILTGEYTVGPNFEKKSRSEHHGKTGLLTTTGFIKGKPGLPHYNYAAQVSMLFLGYVYDVPDEIVEQREGVTALGTTDPNSTCYSCHKILTPLAFQRMNWTDDGVFRERDESGNLIDASDRESVVEYPFAGQGMEAFATQAVRKERFIRTMINTHVNFYFGRPMRYRYDERRLYKRLWDNVHANDFRIKELIRAILLSPEYLGGAPDTPN